MFITGNIGTYAGRIHKLPTGISDISSFASEANNNHISSATKYTYNKWERELRKKKYNLTHTPSYLSTQILNAFGDDPYDGKLVYVQVGGAIITESNPVGTRDLTAISPKVTEIHCHNCPLITSITCNNDTSLTVLDLENCSTLVNLSFTGCPNLTTVNLNTFTTANNWTFSDCPGITSFTASSLSSINSLNLTNSSSGGPTSIVGTFSLPSLVTVTNSLQIYGFGFGTSLLGISLPLLSTVGGTLYIATQNSLGSISLPSLVSAGTINFGQNSSLSTITLASLTSVSTFTTSSNASLTSINVNALNTIGNFDTQNSVSLGLISMPTIDSITDFNCEACTALVSIDCAFSDGFLPLNFLAAGCSSLNEVVLYGAFAQEDCYISMADCALNQLTVDGILSAGINGGTATATYEMNGGTSSPPSTTADVITLQGLGNSVSVNT